MIRELLFHNILAGIKAFRFLISFLIIVGLFIVSAFVFVRSLETTMLDFRTADAQYYESLEAKAVHLNNLAIFGQELFCPPARLQFVSSGFSEQLPNVFVVSAFAVWNFDNVARLNPLFPNHILLDWTFVVSIVLSFVALTLTFDSVTSEKEDGTLRFVLSNTVSRRQFLAAKYLSAVAMLVIPLTVGILLNLVILTLSHPMVLDGAATVEILLVFCVSVVYLSMFALIGLLVSALAHRSAMSLVLCLVVWVVVVLIAPNLGGLLAQTFSPITPARDVEANVSQTKDDIYKRAPGEVWSCFSSDLIQPCYQMRAEMNNELLSAMMRIRKAHRAEQLHQAKVARSWTEISPTVMYQQTITGITNTDLNRVVEFQRQVERYREVLLEFVRSKDAEDSKSPHLINPYDDYLFSSKPVAIQEVPKFTYREPSATEVVNRSLVNVATLVLLNLVLFGSAVVVFEKCDVR